MSGAPGDEGRLPDFVLIGAAKSGTTTLYDYLARHPQIAMARSRDPAVRHKEPLFFDPEGNWHRGVDWYRSLWSEVAPEARCGEASTNYTRHPQVPGVPERMRRVVPGAKLLYLMRDPVERAFSHYVHRWTRELHPGEPFRESFERFVEREPMCLDSSDYALQIRQFLGHYPRAQLLLLRTDELEAAPAALLRRVCDFLEVDPDADLLVDAPLVRNPGGVSEKVLRRHATGPLRRVPGAGRLGRALVPRAWRDRLWARVRGSAWGRRLRAAYEPEPMRPETREALRARYRASNRWLREEFGIDTSAWER